MSGLPTDLFDYDLPHGAIAQFPSAQRSDSRLLVVDRKRRALSHLRFADLAEIIAPGDLLIRNNAGVLPARLAGIRPTGGVVECFLLRPSADDHRWYCLLRPGKKLRSGATFAGAHAGDYAARVIEKTADGTWLVEFTLPRDASVPSLANRIGIAPLPPYLERSDDSHQASDKERYQTVYANLDRRVAVAAPTAGLHFSPELLQDLRARSVEMADVTLHVGLGTFRPMATATVEGHAIHREVYEIPVRTQELLRQNEGRRWAVGTTTVRSTEDFLRRRIPDGSPDFFWRSGDIHFSALPVSRRGSPDHQFPSASLHAALPGGGIPNPRIRRRHWLAAGDLSSGFGGKIPFSQLWRRDADSLAAFEL